jgi:hypothetical protein
MKALSPFVTSSTGSATVSHQTTSTFSSTAVWTSNLTHVKLNPSIRAMARQLMHCHCAYANRLISEGNTSYTVCTQASYYTHTSRDWNYIVQYKFTEVCCINRSSLHQENTSAFQSTFLTGSHALLHKNYRHKEEATRAHIPSGLCEYKSVI